MSISKPERTPNFSPGEKECLFNLMLEHSDVLEDKKTNRTSIQEKNLLWKKIEEQFNNTAPLISYRSAEQLRRLYENKKKELRKKMAEHKKQTFLTGGGPMPDLKWELSDDILIKIINPKTVSGIKMPFDSDGDLEPMPKKMKPASSSLTLEVLPTDDSFILDSLDMNAGPKTSDSIVDPQGQLSVDPNLSGPQVVSPSCSIRASMEAIQERPINNNKENCFDKSQPKSRQITPNSARRRPQAGIRALTSSDISEKYNVLLDRRLVLVNKQIEEVVENQNFAREVQKHKLLLLKQQNDILVLEKEEKRIKVELLKLEVSSKKALLSNI